MIVTLAALVLVSVLVLALFNQSSLNRMISYSSAGQYRADLAAHTAIDTITGDLRNEIAAGSVLTPVSGGSNLYIPTSSFTVIPARVEDQGFTNLVAQSAGSSNFWSGGSYSTSPVSPVRSAPANSTQSRSFNGRYIDPSEWNEAGLLGDPGSAAVPTVPANYIPPDWVIITRRGPLTNAVTGMPTGGVATLANHAPGNLDFAVGRYAYAIYDEGGLLDVNVAGFPKTLNGPPATPFVTARGLLPHIDLASLLGAAPISDPNSIVDADALVTWRNQATASNASLYTNYVNNATNGFSTVAAANSQFTRSSDNTTFTVPAPGDQTLLNREDLINYVRNNSSIPTAALPYLGTSTLDSDQPSYYPASGQDNVTNPQVSTIRVQNGFAKKRPDGTKAVLGEPLLKHRFPLSRLALFNDPIGNDVLIQQYFCMKIRSDGLWDYYDPDTGSLKAVMPAIKTLAQVAATAPGREPTFWELLQAGILTGSLGVEFTGSSIVAGHIVDQNQNTARQIFEIGLSIIDQYDADDNPTVINFGGFTLATEPTSVTSLQATNATKMFVAGVENLPYITWIAQQFCRDNITPDATLPGPNAYIDGYLMFGLWNPHRNASSSSAGTYRIVVNGTTAIQVKNTTDDGKTINYSKIGPQVTHNTTLQFHTTGNRNFSQIDVLRASDADLNATQTTGDGTFPYNSGSAAKEVGLFLGLVDVPKSPDFSSTPPSTSGSFMDILYVTNASVPNVTAISIVLEKQVGSNWIPYQVIPYLQKYQGYSGIDFAQVTSQMNAGKFEVTSSYPIPMIVAYAHSDPRTNRFGLGLASGGQTPLMNASGFNLITPTTGVPISFLAMGTALTSPPFSGTTLPLADYAYNQKADSAGYYTDRDSIVRKGDANPSTLTTHNVVDSPYYSATAARSADGRPVMLNRPFDSVADMGYAFRDDPWRSLNFSSSDSADAGLLDLFSVNETDTANRAGVVDVNGASPEVLAAILQNAYRDPSATDGTPLTAAQALTIAQGVRTQLGSRSSPSFVLQNPADLATLCQKVASAFPTTDTFKFKREAFTRSFADVINTRTWNLMIDVVAQSGRYNPQAKNLNDFTVEGERRYWVHVAIDRPTGVILSTQIEPVTK